MKTRRRRNITVDSTLSSFSASRPAFHRWRSRRRAMPRLKGSAFVFKITSPNVSTTLQSWRPKPSGRLVLSTCRRQSAKIKLQKKKLWRRTVAAALVLFQNLSRFLQNKSLATEIKTGKKNVGQPPQFLLPTSRAVLFFFFFFVKQEAASFTSAALCGGDGKASVRSLQPCFVVFRSVCLCNPVALCSVCYVQFNLPSPLNVYYFCVIFNGRRQRGRRYVWKTAALVMFFFCLFCSHPSETHHCHRAAPWTEKGYK